MGFTNITLKSIGHIPINAPLRQQMAFWRFRTLNLKNKYDLYIIDGDWAMSGAVNNKPNLWYVHSPIRELWDSYKFTRQNVVPGFLRLFFDLWVWYNRYLNRRYTKHVMQIVSNSQNTKKRIKKYLNRDAIVIPPPIDTSKFYYKEHKNYWLSVNRLFAHKRIDLQVSAFKDLPDERLIIVGSYEQSRHFKRYSNYLNKIKPANVEIISWVDFTALTELYASCKGFITTAIDEDFGLTPIEAMASGKPVIATNEGGYKETIIDGITGKLIDKITVKKLIRAIREVGINPEKYKDACQIQAKKFDTTIFIEKMNKMIKMA